MRTIIPAQPEIHKSSNITTTTTAFDGTLLTNSEDTAQKCFDKISANLSSVVPQNGFVNRADSTISVVNGTRTFTIQPVSSSFVFYSGFIKYTKTTPQSIVFADTDGLWHFYFDSTGTLTATQTFSSSIITAWAYVASVYWDATNDQAIFIAEERHGCEMDSQTHLYLHSSFGTQFGTPLGFGLTNIIADGNGSLDSHAQIGVTGGTIWDEDIKHTISTIAAPASIPCFYLTGSGVWRRQTATAYPLIYTVGGLANWNRFQTGAWSLVQCSSGDFVLSHLFATNDPNQSIISIAGQAIYTTVALARAGAKTELDSLVLTGFPSQEFVPIATLIWETRTAYANAPKSRIRTTDSGASYIDFRSLNSASGGSSSITSWGNITGTITNQVDLNTALAGKQSVDADLTAIAALAGTSGFLKKTDADTWALDTASYSLASHVHTLAFQRGATFVNSTALTLPVNNVVVTIPRACTITSVMVLTAGGTGSCVIDIWKSTYAAYPPNSGNTICGASKPTISNGTKYQDTTLTGWTTPLLANDILVFNLTSVSGSFTMIDITITLEYTS